MGSLISIVIPVLNSRKTIRTTVDSVLSQVSDVAECIVVDGKSTDGTLELLQGYGDRIRLISEQDKGIYDAMNKGVQSATGRYIYFLGAGDVLRTNVLNNIVTHLPADNKSLIYGSVFRKDWGRISGGIFSKYTLCFRNICHQAVFYGRDLFTILGCFDSRYAMLADYAMNIRAFGHPDVETRYIDVVVADYAGHGRSSVESDKAFQRDAATLIRNNLGFLPWCVFRIACAWSRVTGA